MKIIDKNKIKKLFKKDEFFAAVPPDVAARLVVRPEDTLPLVSNSIKLFKDTLLRVLEVRNMKIIRIFLIKNNLINNNSKRIKWQIWTNHSF